VRQCKHLTCLKPADVWWNGAWCAFHAYERFGRVPTEMAKLALETARREVALPTRPVGHRFSSVAVPSLRGRGSTSGSLGATDPAPLSLMQGGPGRGDDGPGQVAGATGVPLATHREPPSPFYTDELVALLSERGWDELDLELELISHLEWP
jgi:hypothetical protein